MKKIFFALAIGTAALVSIVSGQAQVSSGLLLGYKEGSSYKTLWIAPQNGKLRMLNQGENLLVPRKIGWWRVSSSKAAAQGGQSNQQFFFAAPVGTPNLSKPAEFDADCQVDSSAALLWVHEKYLALEDSESGYCKGAAHPYAVATLQVRDLDLLRKSGGSANFTESGPNLMEITDLISSSAQAKFYQAGETFHAALSLENQGYYEKSPNVTNWAMIRKSGQWVLRGRLGYSYEAVRNACCIDFDSGITPPTSLVGHDTLAISWKTLLAKNSKIIDAFSSPKNDLLYTLEKTQLTAYALQNGKLGAVLLKVPFKNQVAPVMIEWANAGSVARWTQDLQKLLK